MSVHAPSYGAAAPTILPGEDPAEHAAVLADRMARHAPADAAERFWVGQVVAAQWRLRRLQALEAKAFAAELAGAAPGPEARPLPSLDTLARYAARIDRDLRHAEQRLAALVAKRPATPKSLTGMDALRLRWLADRMDAKAAAAAEAPRTDEPAAPEPARKDEPAAPAPNRAARRRLAALARKSARNAA